MAEHAQVEDGLDYHWNGANITRLCCPMEHAQTRLSLTLDNTLNIKIVSTDGNEVFFKIKKTTKLTKLKVSLDSCRVRSANHTTAPHVRHMADDRLPMLIALVPT